ncbi:MAG: hypothetical protein RL596_334 [Bacteroidota bacterium]|jgi:opacity protein-like surface antigen
MIKKCLTVMLLGLCVQQTIAQNTRINLYGSGVFNDQVDSYFSTSSYYYGTVKGGLQWGAGFEISPRKNLGIEFMYLRQDTHAPITYFNSGIKFTNFDLAVNHYLISVNRYFLKPGSKAELYGSGLIGIAALKLYNPDTGNRPNETKLALGFRGGVNYWATDKVAIKLQAQLLQAVQSVGGVFFFGPGGTGAGIATQSSILQFGLGAGISFKLAKQ